MNSDPLNVLLEKLSGGDAAAAEQVFHTYEPYLRLLVRRMLPGRLRPKFDSADVIQSVWADVFQGFREAGWRFTSGAQLRAFLVTATRHRFFDRYRQHRRAARQQSLDAGRLKEALEVRQPQPSEELGAEELWEQMLALCPPAHRPLLVLKRQGRSLAEIAYRTGLHESSVRRILYDLARRLAGRQRGAGRPEGADSHSGR